ncbi:MAG TPA: hypothetical protein PLH23_18555 [Hyphomonadaceae bacterium]|nr:hypothetical protein [Hyphomonadaceae bacterium]HPI50280.1 hypothetical protein [Hyphomonadaceae bacterium]
MFKIAAACLTAALLCSGCLLTKEDLDCWYDDMCMAANGANPAPSHDVQPALNGR